MWMVVMCLEHVAQEHVFRAMGLQALMSLVSRNRGPKFLNLGASKILIENVTHLSPRYFCNGLSY
jgi:hypothetical protein